MSLTLLKRISVTSLQVLLILFGVFSSLHLRLSNARQPKPAPAMTKKPAKVTGETQASNSQPAHSECKQADYDARRKRRPEFSFGQIAIAVRFRAIQDQRARADRNRPDGTQASSFAAPAKSRTTNPSHCEPRQLMLTTSSHRIKTTDPRRARYQRPAVIHRDPIPQTAKFHDDSD